MQAALLQEALMQALMQAVDGPGDSRDGTLIQKDTTLRNTGTGGALTLIGISIKEWSC